MTEPTFQSMTYDEIRRLYKKLKAEKADTKEVEAYARFFIQAYLDGALAVEEEEAPLFYAFLETFGKEPDGRFSTAAQEAVDKLTVALQRFDGLYGYENLERVPVQTMMENIERLEAFAQINPFEIVEEKGKKKLKYPIFGKIGKALKAVKVTKEDGSEASQEDQKNFRTAMLENARLETYMRLCAHDGIMTEMLYFECLAEIMEINLVNLIVSDKILKEYPLPEDRKKLLFEEFERLFSTIL